MKLVVLCDFDGTIVDFDTSEFLLSRFAEGEWRSYDDQLRIGEISLEECMRRQFSLIKVSREAMLEELGKVVSFRPGFRELAEYCGGVGVALVIVSAGLDFVIDYFLEQSGLGGLVEVFSAKATPSAEGIKLTFPRLLYEESVGFKDDLVRHYKNRSRGVFYIGDDDVIDIHAARLADLTFPIKDSKLSAACRREKIPYGEIGDFEVVIEEIRDSGVSF